MKSLTKEVKQISYRFNADELADLSHKNALLNVEIEEKRQEGKNIASEYTNKVKTLEARRGELSQKILSKQEQRDVFCYARKNYITSTVEYISMDGEIIATDMFRPSDYRKQMELKEEVAQGKLEKVAYFGAKYFYEEFLKINFELDITESEVEEVLETNRIKFITKCITDLVDRKILEVEDDVEFDAMYETVSDWYDGFKTKYREEPKREDFIVEEEQDVFPTNLPDTPLEENQLPEKAKKVKKSKDDKPEETKDEDEDGKPDWLQQ